MELKSLKNLLKVLLELRAAMYDTAEPRVIELLDEAIELLQIGVEKGSVDPSTSDKIIVLIGKIITKLPSIVALMNLLSG